MEDPTPLEPEQSVLTPSASWSHGDMSPSTVVFGTNRDTAPNIPEKITASPYQLNLDRTTILNIFQA